MDGNHITARKAARSAWPGLTTLKNRLPALNGKSAGTGIFATARVCEVPRLNWRNNLWFWRYLRAQLQKVVLLRIFLSGVPAPGTQKSLHQDKKNGGVFGRPPCFLNCRKNQEKDAIGHQQKIARVREARRVGVVRGIPVKMQAPAAGELRKAVAREIRGPKVPRLPALSG